MVERIDIENPYHLRVWPHQEAFKREIEGWGFKFTDRELVQPDNWTGVFCRD